MNWSVFLYFLKIYLFIFCVCLHCLCVTPVPGAFRSHKRVLDHLACGIAGGWAPEIKPGSSAKATRASNDWAFSSACMQLLVDIKCRPIDDKHLWSSQSCLSTTRILANRKLSDAGDNSCTMVENNLLAKTNTAINWILSCPRIQTLFTQRFLPPCWLQAERQRAGALWTTSDANIALSLDLEPRWVEASREELEAQRS